MHVYIYIFISFQLGVEKCFQTTDEILAQEQAIVAERERERERRERERDGKGDKREYEGLHMYNTNLNFNSYFTLMLVSQSTVRALFDQVHLPSLSLSKLPRRSGLLIILFYLLLLLFYFAYIKKKTRTVVR